MFATIVLDSLLDGLQPRSGDLIQWQIGDLCVTIGNHKNQLVISSTSFLEDDEHFSIGTRCDVL
jgi:hypothetical protein